MVLTTSRAGATAGPQMRYGAKTGTCRATQALKLAVGYLLGLRGHPARAPYGRGARRAYAQQ